MYLHSFICLLKVLYSKLSIKVLSKFLSFVQYRSSFVRGGDREVLLQKVPKLVAVGLCHLQEIVLVHAAELEVVPL